MCWSYNRQYGTQYMAVMPTNLYGAGDNYHLENSHVIPALIRKFHEAKVNNAPAVTVWGTGTPKREFLYSDDMAEACIFVINLADDVFKPLLAAHRNDGLPPLLNLGSNADLTIAELASMVKNVVEFKGEIIYDSTKPDGTMRKLMDSERLNRLGWDVSTSLLQGLQASYQDYLTLKAVK
jgi:GDP-L-fucose synthase